jgi:outer membrane protein assembly factor BamE
LQVIDMSHRKNIRHLIPLLLAVFLISSCESWLPDAHRPDFTQGNVIKPEALEKIQIGMKKSEITPILGSPMLIDPFHKNRWDYIYRYLPAGRSDDKVIESRVTLFFEDDRLVKIDDSFYVEPKPDHESKKESDVTPVEPEPKPELD